MSGPKCAGYSVSAPVAARIHAPTEAELARAREQARLVALRGRWLAEQQRYLDLRQRAETLRGRHGFDDAPHIDRLPDAAGLSASNLELELERIGAYAAELDRGLSSQERLARDAVARQAVADVLSSGAGTAEAAQRSARTRRTVDPAPTDTPGDDLAKAEEILGRLAAGIDRPAELIEFADAMVGADRTRRRGLLDRLRTGVSALNTAAIKHQEHEDHQAARRDAEHVLAQSDDAELRALLTASDGNTTALRAGTEAAAERHRAERERGYVQQVLIEVFRELEHDVATGFSVHEPAEGVLVRRDSSVTHGVAVRVQDGAVDIEAVRLATTGGAGHSDADRRAEEELCSIAPRLWKALRDKGIAVDGLTSVPVGVQVPRTVDVTATGAGEQRHGRGRTSVRAKERRLR